MNTQITIEQLAQQLNQTVWTKGDLKRIYLNDKGHNTKKMATKTFIWQNQNGDFEVSCKVECPSQPWQWCKSQEDQIKQSVQNDIQNAIAIMNLTLVDFKILEETPSEVMVYVKDNADAEPVWYTEQIFFDKFGSYPENIFDSIPKIEAAVSEPIEVKEYVKPVSKVGTTETPEFGISSKVKHGKFGIGVVVAEDATKVEVNFAEIGNKIMVKQFVALEIV